MGRCGIARQERSVREHIDQTWDTPRQPIDFAQRAVTQDFTICTRRDGQSMTHIRHGIGLWKGGESPADTNALSQLTQRLRIEFFIELWLAQENDLNEL